MRGLGTFLVAAPHLVARLDAQAGEGKRGWRADWIGRDSDA